MPSLGDILNTVLQEARNTRDTLLDAFASSSRGRQEGEPAASFEEILAKVTAEIQGPTSVAPLKVPYGSSVEMIEPSPVQIEEKALRLDALGLLRPLTPEAERMAPVGSFPTDALPKVREALTVLREALIEMMGVVSGMVTEPRSTSLPKVFSPEGLPGDVAKMAEFASSVRDLVADLPAEQNPLLLEPAQQDQLVGQWIQQMVGGQKVQFVPPALGNGAPGLAPVSLERAVNLPEASFLRFSFQEIDLHAVVRNGSKTTEMFLHLESFQWVTVSPGQEEPQAPLAVKGDFLPALQVLTKGSVPLPEASVPVGTGVETTFSDRTVRTFKDLAELFISSGVTRATLNTFMANSFEAAGIRDGGMQLPFVDVPAPSLTFTSDRFFSPESRGVSGLEDLESLVRAPAGMFADQQEISLKQGVAPGTVQVRPELMSSGVRLGSTASNQNDASNPVDMMSFSFGSGNVPPIVAHLVDDGSSRLLPVPSFESVQAQDIPSFVGSRDLAPPSTPSLQRSLSSEEIVALVEPFVRRGPELPGVLPVQPAHFGDFVQMVVARSGEPIREGAVTPANILVSAPSSSDLYRSFEAPSLSEEPSVRSKEDLFRSVGVKTPVQPGLSLTQGPDLPLPVELPSTVLDPRPLPSTPASIPSTLQAPLPVSGWVQPEPIKQQAQPSVAPAQLAGSEAVKLTQVVPTGVQITSWDTASLPSSVQGVIEPLSPQAVTTLAPGGSMDSLNLSAKGKDEDRDGLVLPSPVTAMGTLVPSEDVIAQPQGSQAPSSDPRVDAAEVLGRISEQVRSRTHELRALSHLSFQLMPESLGRVTVQLALVDHAVSAKIIVTRPEVREALQTNLVELRTSLNQAGLQIDQLQVQVQGGGANLLAQYYQFQQEGSGYRLPVEAASQGLEGDGIGENKGVPSNLSRRLSLVDVLA